MPDEELNNENSDMSDDALNGAPGDLPEASDDSESVQGTGPDDIKEPSMDDSVELSQEEIEAAFRGENGTGSYDEEPSEDNSQDVAASPEPPPVSQPAPTRAPAEVNQNSTHENMSTVRVKDFDQLSDDIASGEAQNINMLLDVTLPISIELGRTSMPIQDILNLGPGSVVELNRLAGEPVDLLVNNKLIAKGEVVVVDENFGIRVTSMVSQEERIKSLG